MKLSQKLHIKPSHETTHVFQVAKCEFFGSNFDKAVVVLKDGTRVSEILTAPFIVSLVLLLLLMFCCFCCGCLVMVVFDIVVVIVGGGGVSHVGSGVSFVDIHGLP